MAGSHRLSGAAVGLALPTAIAALTAPATRAQTALTNPRVLFAATQTESLRSADAQVQSTRRGGELELAQIATDPLVEGRAHERLVQRYRGLPVFGGVLMRQMDRGFMRTTFGRIYPGITVSTQPAIDAATARAVAAVGRPEALGSEAFLGILPTSRGEHVLVWTLVVRSGVDVRDVSVNAVTGAIERSRTPLRDQIPNYTITRQFAVGGARVSRAADDVETETDQFVSIKTGGLQVGGVRFLF
jgi:Fungalysin/Thermolysin Propeptide Motif